MRRRISPTARVSQGLTCTIITTKTGVKSGNFLSRSRHRRRARRIVTITSTGSVLADASVKKVIQVQMGIPSFAKYAWALDDSVYISEPLRQVYGTIYSNAGIHFDGVAHNLVESALATYTDPDSRPYGMGVYTDGPPADPQPPTPLLSQPDVFMAGRNIGGPRA